MAFKVGDLVRIKSTNELIRLSDVHSGNGWYCLDSSLRLFFFKCCYV